MCVKNVVRRSGAFLSALVLCFSLTVPALADETLLSGTAGITYAGLAGTLSSGSWGLGSSTVNISSGSSLGGCSPYSYFGMNGAKGAFGWKSLALSSDLYPEGATSGVYLSCYYTGGGSYASSQNKAPAASDFTLQVKSSSTGAYSTLPVDVTLYAPSNSASSMSDGATISSRFANSVVDPYSSVILFNGSAGSNAPAWYMVPVTGSFNSSGTCAFHYFFVSSFRVVSTATNAELDSLESMASEIAAQSQILSQFYGDIVAVCNQIYQRLGDLQAAQEEANALFSSVISLLNTTNSKLSAINTAMSTYFELVLKSLENESLSIQDCIDDAELRLETYLKPIVDYFTELEETTGESASSLPSHKTDLNKWSSDSTGIDADAQTGLAAVLPILSAFSFIFSVLGIFIGLGVFMLIIRKGLS